MIFGEIYGMMMLEMMGVDVLMKICGL